MWFARRRNRPQLDLAALDRLSDTIARAVALIEERLSPTSNRTEPRRRVDIVVRREPGDHESGRREPEPVRPEWRPEPEPELETGAEPEPAPVTAGRQEAPAGFVLFVPTAAGYRLAMPVGITPEPRERLRVEEEWYRVLRLGPSPLPGDRRRCAFLEPLPATLE